MEYMSTKEATEKWDISERRIQKFQDLASTETCGIPAPTKRRVGKGRKR